MLAKAMFGFLPLSHTMSQPVDNFVDNLVWPVDNFVSIRMFPAGPK